MNKSQCIFIFWLILGFSCKQEDADVCLPAPCPKPNINNLLSLVLSFENFSDHNLSDIQIIRIDKYANSPIDTVSFNLSSLSDKRILIGRDGEIGFSEPMFWEVVEDARLNYKILINEWPDAYEISDIDIERVSSSEECTCPDYQIGTLKQNGTTIEINAHNYLLTLN